MINTFYYCYENKYTGEFILCQEITNVMASPTYLYFVRFIQKSTKEKFVKTGITKHTITQRFSGCKKKYNIETLFITKLPLLECINLEKNIIYKMKKYQYIPEGKFGGKTECFIDIPKVEQKILQLLE